MSRFLYGGADMNGEQVLAVIALLLLLILMAVISPK